MERRTQADRDRAKRKVLTELVNALLEENFAGMRESAEVCGEIRELALPLDEGEQWLRVAVGSAGEVVFRVREKPRFRSWEMSRPPVVLRGNGEEPRELDAPALMRLLAETSGEVWPNLDGVCEELRLSVEQHVLSCEADGDLRQDSGVSLKEGERFAALRDRPFHPLSRVKNGWNAEEYRLYSPEFGRSFGLDWVAVRTSHVTRGEDHVDDLPELLLSPEEAAELRSKAAAKGVKDGECVLIPVHPWQMKRVIPKVFEAELEDGIIVPVAGETGCFRPGSSVRSLICLTRPDVHVKVPLGIYSLGALRILPPRYLRNAVIAQGLIREIIHRDWWLAEHLLVCDESRWATFLEPGSDQFADKAGHLGCVIRRYPREVTSADTVVPMSALSVHDEKGDSPLLQFLLSQGYGDGRELFGSVCRVLIRTACSFIRYGVLPELHGQNVVLLMRRGKAERLLIRDHDTLRISPEWMKRAGIPEISYVLRPGTRNTLVLPSLEELIAYLQTLVIQVNLASVMEAFVKGGHFTGDEGWSMVEEILRHELARIESPELAEEARRVLLLAEDWPMKEIIAPLLRRQGTGGGSMPSGMGRIANPFRRSE